MRTWIVIVTMLMSFSLQTHAATAPSHQQMQRAQQDYARYCAACHGKSGEGRTGPALKGSPIVTGPMGASIHFVITGESHTKMPAWGLTALSDDMIAEVLTYVRNSWGNNNVKQYGKNAGGVVTPALVKKYRGMLRSIPDKKKVQTL
ncbi:MAG: cytochrome c [Coxiellaceae bacterium]|nr:cytochrome c [Coxiellaceae bacterium]